MNVWCILQHFTLILWVHFVTAGRTRLSDYISHYEELTYDTQTLHSSHSRARRSLESRPTVHLDFRAHNRDFHLRLRRDLGTFSSNAERELSDGTLQKLDTSHIYQGHMEGMPGSHVHGSIINGIFSGVVHTPSEKYYIDKSEVYFDSPKFHSVIYSDEDVITSPKRLRRSAKGGNCAGSEPSVREWMDSVANSATGQSEARKKRDLEDNFYEKVPHNWYTESANQGGPFGGPARHERRRAVEDNRRTCTLFLQSDTLLWDYMTGPTKEKKLGYNDQRAMEEITSLFASHVSGIKTIYESTVFEQDNQGPYRGFSFVVRRVRINTTEDCELPKSQNNPFCKPNIDVSNFLNLNSLSKHNLFCLAYVFTFRDFTGGTLGLAWVGSHTTASGGICEIWKEYKENGRRIYKSLNTGIVTLVNYGTRVPPKVSTLTFAHEVGHNFGAPHDNGGDCVPTNIDPNNPDGNYIMFASATSGDRANNNKFSKCSIGNMTRVLDAVLKGKNEKKNCLVASEEAFCGNAILEQDEVCDCGFRADCMKTDVCCHPNEDDNKCTLKRNKTCSPSQGPCCNRDCTKVPEEEDKVCAIDTECSKRTSCNGVDAKCPKPEAKPDMTPCNDNTQICLDGGCQGTICQRIQWEQCYITPPEDDKNFDKGTLCYVACQNPSTQECVSTGDRARLQDPGNDALLRLLRDILGMEDIRLPPGAPCDNFQGYCDVFQKCRGVDADGPLARLKNLLLNEQTLNTIRDWIIEYWWAVLLMGVGLVVFMGIFIKLCAVHTPSSNPKRKPARKISLKPQPQHARHQGPPPGYPGSSRGGPPHGRGRGPTHSNRPPPYNAQGQGYEMKPHRV